MFDFERQIADVHRRFGHLDHKVDCALAKIDAGLNALHVLLRYALENSMSKLHDDLLATAQALNTKVDALGPPADTVIAAKTEGEAAYADIRTSLEAANEKIDALAAKFTAAAADDASTGSSTGAGSGSGTATGAGTQTLQS